MPENTYDIDFARQVQKRQRYHSFMDDVRIALIIYVEKSAYQSAKYVNTATYKTNKAVMITCTQGLVSYRRR